MNLIPYQKGYSNGGEFWNWKERQRPPESFPQESSLRKHHQSADFHREQRFEFKKSGDNSGRKSKYSL
ncbi:hypothetical protein P40081_33185 [Paenibacillus sp. FSL P4-0081]|nr:hypothetical protein P40081_33185 [Paenibacillus sp. FSL P4-0081]